MHHPVLLKAVIDNLGIKKGGLYIDATYGEGGHSLEILKKEGKVLAIDTDFQQILNFKFQISNWKNLTLVQGNFKDIEKIAKENDFYPVDGILFDLGLSIKQIQESGKGFSFKNSDEPLDMRLNNDLKIKASDLINSLNKEDLYEILARYSEEINSRAIADFIFRTRSLKKILTVGDLVSVIEKAIGKKGERVLRRIFQGLRIAVNDELENLKKGLTGGLRLIKKDGKILVITFHSLEDRIVKQFGAGKPILGDRKLSFERSAKLRVISLG